jgi:hypothetical protein
VVLHEYASASACDLREINDLARARSLRLMLGMTTSNSIASTSRKIMWIGTLLMAASAVACGGTTQALGTAPSGVPAVAAAPDAGGTFGTLKDGKGKDSTGKGPDRGDTPTAGTAPSNGGAPDTDTDDPETGAGHGHGHQPEPGDDHGHDAAMTQLEGFSTSITGTCPSLTIEINGMTVTTDLTTDFQRGVCTDLVPTTTTPPPTGTTPTAGTTPAAGTEPPAQSFHLHIAATADATGKLVASYVRLQGGDETGGDDDSTTPPTQ